MTYYIQRREGRNLETIDECASQKEARSMIIEYRIADPTAEHYISQRCCNNWRD